MELFDGVKSELKMRKGTKRKSKKKPLAGLQKEIDKFIKDWYSEATQIEWKRLKQDPYHQIEFFVTIHFLEKYLPKKGRF